MRRTSTERGGGNGSQGSLMEAAGALAHRVRLQWQAEERDRGLRSPRPARVGWQRLRAAAVAPASGPATADASSELRPLPGVAPLAPESADRGTVDDLFGLYAANPSGCLLVVGSAGSGKTSAAIRLVLDALEHRDAHPDDQIPVPVLLTPHDWGPGSIPLKDWLVARLVRDHGCRGSGPGSAARLVAEGLVSLVLDGLDDVPIDQQSEALAAICRLTALRIVVTARTATLIEATADGPVRGATAVELRPVEPADAGDYLARAGGDAASPAWDRLVDHVRAHPRSPVAEVARSPFMLSLLRDYTPRDEVDALGDADAYPDVAALEDHLLDRVLPGAYATRRGDRRPRLTAEQATVLFGWLAQQMGTGHDLRWWQVRAWVPGAQLVADRVVTTVMAAGVAVALWSFGGILLAPAGWVLGSLWSRSTKTVAADAATQDPKRLARFRWAEAIGGGRLRYGLGAAVLSGLAALCVVPGGIAAGVSPAWAGAYGVVTGITVWLVCGFARSEVDPACPMTPLASYRADRSANLLAALAFGLLSMLGFGVAFSPVMGVAIGIATVCFHMAPSQSFQAAAASFRMLGSPRLLATLEDARRRGVLRTAGQHYQFRHARLQRRLADTHLRRG